MKYLGILEERGLLVSDLPKTIQKKVNQINALSDKLRTFKLEGDIEDEDMKADLEKIETAFDALDEELFIYIGKFNLEKHLENVKRLEGMRAKSPLNNPSVKKAPETVLEKAAPVEAPAPSVKVVQEARERIDAADEEVSEILDLADRMVEKESVSNTEEEFHAEAAVPKKGINKNMLIIGIGAFILTFGVVNLIKDNRNG